MVTGYNFYLLKCAGWRRYDGMDGWMERWVEIEIEMEIRGGRQSDRVTESQGDRRDRQAEVRANTSSEMQKCHHALLFWHPLLIR